MKKIAIVTFHNACNYGAYLQAYSLHNTVSSVAETEAYILDYYCKIISDVYTVNGKLHSAIKKSLKPFSSVKSLVALLLQMRDILKRNQVFAQSRKKHFHVLNKNLSKEDLPGIVHTYDCFIAGSDQIWNRNILGDDNAFFLDFVEDPKKKYSYAASIGHSDLSKDILDDLAGHLHDFQRISLREPDALPSLQERLGADRVQCNIDPVFLPGANHWRSFMQRPQRKPYVLFFTLYSNHQGRPAMRFAKQLADKNGLEALYLSNIPQWYRMRELKHFGVASPEQFVGLIDQAEYVVTNSFHGTAFCIILHKPFFVETNIPHSGRITHLLELCGLSDRALKSGHLLCEPKPIDWDEVDRRLAVEREKSLQYLRDIGDALNGQNF